MIFTSTAALFATFLAPIVHAQQLTAPVTTTRNTTTIRPANESSLCASWYLIQPGDTCESIVNSLGVTYDTLWRLNPSINADCTNLPPGFGLCLSDNPTLSAMLPSTETPPTTLVVSILPDFTGTPSSSQTSSSSFIQSMTHSKDSTTTTDPPLRDIRDGVTEKCNMYQKVEEGDTCVKIAKQANVQEKKFEMWNNIDKDCKDLEVDSYVCIRAFTETW